MDGLWYVLLVFFALFLLRVPIAVVLISHDWHLLSLTVDRLWLVADGTVRAWEGDLEDYRRYLLEARAAQETAEERSAGDAKREARREAAERRQVLGRGAQDARELRGCLVEVFEIDERATERHAGRQVIGMMRETFAADANGLLELAGAATLLRELRKGQRRRILLDPASQVFEAVRVGHADSLLCRGLSS